MALLDANYVLKLYEQAKQIRQPNEDDWRTSAAYCLPRQYNMWTSMEGPPNLLNKGTSQTRRLAYDSTASRALPKYAAVLERIATPHNMVYQNLIASDPALMRVRRVREYLEGLRDLIFQYRYGPRANFGRSAAEVYLGLGAYGTGPLYLGRRSPNSLFKGNSFLYKAVVLRDMYILINDEGEVVACFRRFWLNARQFQEKFPDQPLPPSLARANGSGEPKEQDYVEFVHYCAIRAMNDYDPQALDARRHPIQSCYLCVKDKMYIGNEDGYRSFPYLFPRTLTEAGNPYGFSPAQAVLAAMGTASAMKKTMIKAGQKGVDPTLLAHDDGVIGGKINQTPGAIIYGAIDKQGRELVKPMQTGNLQIGKELIKDEREDINDSFFVTLFQILMETPEMTAAEVYERVAERTSLLSPTMNSIQDEMLAPQTMREIDLLIDMGLVADGPKAPGLQMPPELIEAKGQYDIVYTSPMAKGMYAEEVSGFMRALQTALEAAQATQDMSPMDNFNLDTAIPEMANFMNVPARWMNDEATKKTLRDARAQQQQQAALMKNAAPLASAAKTVTDAQTLATTKPNQ